MPLSRHSLFAASVAAIAAAVIGSTLTTAQDGGSPSSHPGAGVPDPSGRITFGRITRMDDFLGQVVALYAIDPDGSDLVQLNDGESGYPAWSPDGTRLAFEQVQPDGTTEVATMAADGSDLQVLTSGDGAGGPSWSPDGSWMAYAHSAGPPTSDAFHVVVYRMDADGSNPELIGDPDGFDLEPRVSPDGTRVVFERLSFQGDTMESILVVRDLASGAELVLEGAGKAVEHGNWSPDGEWIIYNIHTDITGDAADERLARIRADGTGDEVVVMDPGGTGAAFKPWYSPDGSRILFGCTGASGDDAACLIDADGSGLEILIDEPGVHENHFSWGVAAQ